MNLLYIIDRDQYINKMSRVRFHAIEALSKLTNIIIWGPNWRRYNINESLTLNINKLNLNIDGVICYKPSSVIGFCDLTCLKIMTYNEMWDETYTLKEINDARPNLVICHHENDMKRYRYEIYKNINCYTKFVHIHHSANSDIFYDRKENKTIDILLVGSVGRHYPLRQRFEKIIKMMPSKFVCIQYKHPGYIHANAFTDIYLKDFAENMSKSKICLTCTSRYKYLLGKLIEIPMCGSVIASDLPAQNIKLFEEMMIVISNEMTDEEIVNKLVYYLENNEELEIKKNLGLSISKNWGQDRYAKLIYDEINKLIDKNYKIKLFVQSEDIKLDEKWICDILKDEFINYCNTSNLSINISIVNDINECDIIWLLAPWKERSMNKKLLNEKFVITTIHHIDWDKYDEFKNYYDRIDSYTNRYHSICQKTTNELKKITNKDIITTNFWINNTYFYISDKVKLRNKYNLPNNAFIIGSFQKDTEGKGDLPKLSKGPDIFIKIVQDIYKNNNNIMVLLTGWRRGYIINELNKLNIPYCYHELVSLNVINELYNCLDLYIVSSRVEGGPRSIMECGLTRTPLISTNVGIAELIVHKSSMFDSSDWITYKNAFPNPDQVYHETYKYTINQYMNVFINKVFYESINKL
jgi:hypothetical protein